jgi:glycerophosphoryl diester phosphodiesterase
MNVSQMQAIGHRGFAAAAPENTLVSFRAGMEAGADMLECDVTLTKDKIPVILHDRRLDRTTNGHGSIGSARFSYVRTLDAGGWFGNRFAGEKVPRLGEVLDLTRGKIPMNVEIKMEAVSLRLSGGVEEKLVEEIARRAMEKDVVVSSFFSLAIRRVKKLNSRIETGHLFGRRFPKNWKRALEKSRANAVHLFVASLTEKLLDEIRAEGYPVRVYTVNQVAEIRQMAAWGVDAIFTDEVLRAVEIVRDLG